MTARFIRRPLLAGVVAASLALVVLASGTLRTSALDAANAATPLGSDTHLEEGLQSMVALLRRSAEAYPEASFAVEAGSADVRQAEELRNNYSFSDASDQARYPGYNDCDAWRNLLRDGWSATYSLTATVSEAQAVPLLNAVSEFWIAGGYAVERHTVGEGASAVTRIWADLKHGSVALAVRHTDGRVWLHGVTDCLAPN